MCVLTHVFAPSLPVQPGQQFSGQIVPSATVLVVGVGRAEAKVEGLFSEVCRLNYKGNVFDSMGGEVLKGEEPNAVTNALPTSFGVVDTVAIRREA